MVETSAYLNIAGLLFDISGVLLVFLYTLPVMMGEFLKERFSEVGIKDAKKLSPQIAEAVIHRHRSRIGLGFLIFGFTLQAFGNIVILVS